MYYAPVLFNLYFCASLRIGSKTFWLLVCHIGIYSHRHKLVGDFTSWLTKSKFSDYTALYASLHDGLEEVALPFLCGKRRWA